MKEKEIIKKILGILDDIDTYSDMCKDDYLLYSKLVNNKQAERWLLPITADGYNYFVNGEKI